MHFWSRAWRWRQKKRQIFWKYRKYDRSSSRNGIMKAPQLKTHPYKVFYFHLVTLSISTDILKPYHGQHRKTFEQWNIRWRKDISVGLASSLKEMEVLWMIAISLFSIIFILHVIIKWNQSVCLFQFGYAIFECEKLTLFVFRILVWVAMDVCIHVSVFDLTERLHRVLWF